MAVEKFNGKGNVLIRAINEENINGVEYGVGDIIAYIPDIKISVGYKSIAKSSTSPAIQSVNVEYFPEVVILENVKNTEEIRNLLYQEKKRDSSISFYREYLELAKGTIYLKTQRSILEIKTFSEGQPIEVDFNWEDKTVTLDKTYKDLEIFVFTDQDSIEYRLKKPNYGYVSLLVVIEGKFGENEGEFTLNIPKSVLLTDPTFAISEDSYGTDLAFSIISDRIGKEPVVNYIGKE